MAAGTIATVANSPKEGRRTRSFREDDELWERADEIRARLDIKDMTAVLHEALVNWIKEREGK